MRIKNEDIRIKSREVRIKKIIFRLEASTLAKSGLFWLLTLISGLLSTCYFVFQVLVPFLAVFTDQGSF
jgi:hypothetical protein